MRPDNVKKCYLVYGPESSGTRLLTRIILACGALGDGQHQQRLDDMAEQARVAATATRCVFRRSLPHGGKWTIVKDELAEFIAAGYKFEAFVLTRDWHSSIKSQIKQNHVSDESQALANLRHAYPHILGQLVSLGITYTIVNYESIIYEDDFARRFCERHNIGTPMLEERITNENAKWRS